MDSIQPTPEQKRINDLLDANNRFEQAARDARAAQRGGYQDRVSTWLLACFGMEIAADRTERSHRFIEEALELVQACGTTPSEAHQLVDYVFNRPIGDRYQEVGGVMNTLAALCLAHSIDMLGAGETELTRCWVNLEKIRAKQAAKPEHSPLPEHATVSAPELGPHRQFGDRALLDRLRAVLSDWEDLPAHTHQTAVSTRLSEAAFGMQQLQMTGDHFWPVTIPSPAVAPAIKPLEWFECWRGFNEDIPSWQGKNPLGMHLGVDFAGKYKLEKHSDAPADELAERKAAEQARYERAIRSALEEEAQVDISIKPMKLSDGRVDHYVSFRCGARELTPHKFREQFKAEYHVAIYRWLFGQCEKPDLIAFDKSEWPAREYTAEEQQAFAALCVAPAAVEMGYGGQLTVQRHPYEDVNQAINFALDTAFVEGCDFLRVWREGDWQTLDREWPEWKASFAKPEQKSGA